MTEPLLHYATVKKIEQADAIRQHAINQLRNKQASVIANSRLHWIETVIESLHEYRRKLNNN